ncbi:MAG: polysaccharide biosynthesis C-terminal domain-containing protein [Bacteroidales bacterium]|nr:polysaccharide biosynthesis C-terminal domain-containing protein [Bacteroidales bacterium]
MLKNILNTLFTKFFFAGVNFAILMIVSHILGTAGKGEQAIISFNIYISMLILTLIGNSTLIYLTPRKDFSSLFLPSLIWIVFCTIIISVFSAFNWLYVSLIAFFGALSEINYYILLGRERIAGANGVKLTICLTNIIFIGTLSVLNVFNDVKYYVYSVFLAHFLGFLFGFIALRDDYFSMKLISINQIWRNFKLLFSLGFVKQIGSIAQTLSYRLSFYILAAYCSKSLVGIYSNACSIGEAVMLFGTSLALVQYSKLSNTENKELSINLTLKLTSANAVFTFLALLVLCLLPKTFWIFAFGQGFGEIGFIIRLLSLGLMLLSCSSNFTQYFASKGNFSISTFAALAGFVVTAVLCFLLIPKYNIVGAAVTACVSYSVTFLIEFIYFLIWKKRNI